AHAPGRSLPVTCVDPRPCPSARRATFCSSLLGGAPRRAPACRNACEQVSREPQRAGCPRCQSTGGMRMSDLKPLEARLADPEAGEQLARIREQFVSFAAPGTDGAQLLALLLAPVAHAFPNFRPASTPEGVFDQLVAVLFEFLALVAPWWDRQPGAVAKAGLVVPLSQMPPIEIAALLKAHHDGGADATIEFVRCYY